MKLFLAHDRRLRAIWRFLIAVVAAYFANVLAAELASMFGQGRRFEIVFRPVACLLVLIAFLALTLFVDQVRGSPFRALGLAGSKGSVHDIAFGIAIGFLMVSAAVLTIVMVAGIDFRGIVSHRFPLLLTANLIILASGAMLEELLFRGYPFQRLIETLGPIPATGVLSCLFGLIHLANPGATLWSTLNTTAMGVLFSLAYLRTRSLWLPWGLHFAWNTTLGVLFGLPVSGMRWFSVFVRGVAHGPVWLTGGRYGIEGSALGFAVIIAGCFVLMYFAKPVKTCTETPTTDFCLVGNLANKPNPVSDPQPTVRIEIQ